MFINVYPSQDNNNQTLWIFSGSSTAAINNSIRTSSTSGYNGGDSWNFRSTFNNGNIYDANRPTNSNISLSSLFSSTNTIDIDSVRKRIPGGGRTNITFAASATNAPTITISSGSRTISHLFMDDDSGGVDPDDIGIRVSGSALSYSTGQSSVWVGAGLINKPIGDFHTGSFDNWSRSSFPDPRFAATSNGSVRVVVNNQIIPEPKEYALIFGLFALGYVIARRRFQKKKRQQAATS